MRGRRAGLRPRPGRLPGPGRCRRPPRTARPLAARSAPRLRRGAQRGLPCITVTGFTLSAWLLWFCVTDSAGSVATVLAGSTLFGLGLGLQGNGIIPSRSGLLHRLDFVHRLREASQGTSALRQQDD
jgi:hypothetical protein